MGCQGKRWYRSYQRSSKQIRLFKHRITWNTSFGQRGWHICKLLGGWLQLRQLLQNNHRFMCHNSIFGTRWLRWNWGICGGQTHLVIFFILFAHYFQLNLDETYFLCREGELRIIGGNDKLCHDKRCSDLRFPITVLQVGSVVGVNGSVILLQGGKRCTKGWELTTWWSNMDYQKNLVWLRTKQHTWMMRLGQRWWKW